jgi:hypothetical protein
MLFLTDIFTRFIKTFSLITSLSILPVFFVLVLEYYLTKLILAANGIIPWRCHRFLDWACDRFILQKAGADYIVIHRVIREHLAEMDIYEFMREFSERS